jgi:hypothetical protein
MRRRCGWVEERVRTPHLIDVINPKSGVLEEMRNLVIDLERLLIVKQVEIQELGHSASVLQANTLRCPEVEREPTTFGL